MIDDVAYLVLAHAAGATRSPEEAIHVLNVLPTYRAPSVLAAALSRGFHEFCPSRAIKHGLGLALLPHYPFYMLFDNLSDTLEAAGARGDLPTIELLWKLAGPSTPGRQVWADGFGFIAEAVTHGHVHILEWISNVGGSLGIPWSSVLWHDAADEAHTGVVQWAINHGHIRFFTCQAALLSTRDGERSLFEWWITDQLSKEWAMAQLNETCLLAGVSGRGAIGALDYWWAYTGAKLPAPKALASIADAALCSKHLKVVEWWWTRFLEHRTPEHKFGEMQLEISGFCSIDTLDWYWCHYNEFPEYFSHSFGRDNAQYGLFFTIQSPTTLPILKWAVEKCTVLGIQKLSFGDLFMRFCASDGNLDMLKLVLQSTDVLTVEYLTDFLTAAVENDKIAVLEWWNRHQAELAPQNLDCAEYLSNAVQHDAVNVIAWWHAHQLPVTKNDWQCVCSLAIKFDAWQVQLWLLDHMSLFTPETDEQQSAFADICMDALHATPFTLDFVDTIFPDLDLAARLPAPGQQAFDCLMEQFWWCRYTNTPIASLLPLKPSILGSLLNSSSTVALEWWLQAHLAAGHALVFPADDKLFDIYSTDKGSFCWMCDVISTRKIPVFSESDSGVVPHSLPSMSYDI